MGRRMWAALLVAAIIALLCLGGYAYDRQNCVCYTALHSPGKFLPVDKRASDALGDHQLSNETISLVTVKCRHGYNTLLHATTELYSSQIMSAK